MLTGKACIMVIMSTQYTLYELERLLEFRRLDVEEAVRRKSLLSSARKWVIGQGMIRDPEVELSRAAGGRV